MSMSMPFLKRLQEKESRFSSQLISLVADSSNLIPNLKYSRQRMELTVDGKEWTQDLRPLNKEDS